jgi:hypothetical protein
LDFIFTHYLLFLVLLKSKTASLRRGFASFGLLCLRKASKAKNPSKAIKPPPKKAVLERGLISRVRAKAF